MKQFGLSLTLGAVVGLGLCLPGSLKPAQGDQPPAQVQIRDVEVRLSDQGPVVLLKAENRFIPVFVDPTVAGSIQGALSGEKAKRPLSHDLMHTILDSFGGKVTQTVITLKDGIFYAALTVAMQGSTKVFDSRSSDSIALAIHFKAPIIVGRDLLESAGRTMPDSRPQTL